MAWLRRSLLALLILIVAVAGGIYYYLSASLPKTSGRIVLSGIGAPVNITRDSHGVPTIQADSIDDAYFALGFLHAQDRLFQMDLQRRLGAGRLSELFGAKALRTDRQMRIFGLYRDAVGEIDHISAEFRGVLDAYTAGVNAYLDQRPVLSPEFAVLGYRPERWRPADSLVFGKLLALELSGNFRRELLRAKLATKLTPVQVQDLFPDYPKDGPITLQFADLYKTLPLDRMLAALPPVVGPTPASNNWVLDSKHSATGKPLLANDPHLDYSAPTIWYLARIEAPGIDITGGTVAGAPLVVLGHNQRIAWGYTTTNADVEDLFIERADPNDPTRYLTPDGSAPFETRSETIAVRGDTSQILTIRSTRHGPVISDVDGSAKSEILALSATFLTEDDLSEEAQWRINLAHNWTEFVAAISLFVAPEQNMVYADVDGNIGFYAPAKIPIRKAGDGTVPAPGWTGDYDWTGWVPFDALPHSLNPQVGRIATANNRIVPENYQYLITKDWDLPFRVERIETRLQAQPVQTVASSTSIMQDDVSLTAATLLPLLLRTAPANDQQRKIHQMLARWDHTMNADRPEPLIFSAWLRALDKRIYADELGEIFPEFLNANPLFIEKVLTADQQWCDDVATTAVETCDAQVSGALNDAIKTLGAAYGSDMNAWRWGNPHQASFPHILFQYFPILRGIYGRSIAADGGSDTVNAGAFADDGTGDAFYLDVHGASLRAIYDLSDLEKSVFMMAPGESGNLLSAHYDDLLQPWRNFDWFRLPRDADGDVLVLQPR